MKELINRTVNIPVEIRLDYFRERENIKSTKQYQKLRLQELKIENNKKGLMQWITIYRKTGNKA